MHRRSLGILSAIFVASACAAGCSDVGDTTALPDLDATGTVAASDAIGPNVTADAATADAKAPSNDGATASETGASVSGGSTSGVSQSSAGRSSTSQAGASQSSESHSSASQSTQGTGPSDAEATDVGSMTSPEGGPDGAIVDATVDAPTTDAESEDGTVADSGEVDATVDGSVQDASGRDAIADSGSDTGSEETDASCPPTPCTSAPCSAQCGAVECDGNKDHGDVCTPTEALIVQRDIDKGYLLHGQLDPNASCYECLVGYGGLDDDLVASDKGNECADVLSTAMTLTGEAPVQACLDTLSCILQQACNDNGPSTCLCGTAAGAACLTAGAANGPCLQNEINGLDVGTGTTLGMLVEGDPAATQEAFPNPMLASGMANTLTNFAFDNCQDACTP